MKEWKRGPRREKRLERQMQHDRAVFADGIKHDRPLAFSDGLTHDVDALGFKTLEMCQPGRDSDGCLERFHNA